MSPSQPTVVVKVGTSSLLRDGVLHLSQICAMCETVSRLHKRGLNVVIVSSGAVGAGMFKMGFDEKPKEVAKKQALAAVGQVHLMRHYEDIFSTIGLKCAQVLLTLGNLSDRKQYVRAKNTFAALLDMGVVPIVNENDTVAVEELRFGDNDTLSAQVAALVEAKWLFLLTDVEGLYTANPGTNPDARLIEVVDNINDLNVDVGGAGTSVGTGGMVTKLTAARIACAAGCKTIVCLSSRMDGVEAAVLEGVGVGTPSYPRRRRPRVKRNGSSPCQSPGRSRCRKKARSTSCAGCRFSCRTSPGASGTSASRRASRSRTGTTTSSRRGLCNYASDVVQRAVGAGEAAAGAVADGDEWEDDLDGPPECFHANNVCVTHVETLARSLTMSDFIASGYDSADTCTPPPGSPSRIRSPGPA